MSDRPISPAGPYPHDAAAPTTPLRPRPRCAHAPAAPTPPLRLIPGAVPWRERRLSCPVAATLLHCDATAEEAADVYAATLAEAQATIARLVALDARMPPMVIDLDPWEDIGDGIAIRRERGRVVEVRVAGANLSPSIVYSLGAVDEKRGGGVLCMVGAWEQIGEAWYIRVREQQ